jgi:ketopantoate reductase
MNKRINLIIGSGVLGAYLSAELLKKKEKVIVTTRLKLIQDIYFHPKKGLINLNCKFSLKQKPIY